MTVITIPYKPRSCQKRIHQLSDDRRFAVVVAHRRLGKTVACVNQLIKRSIVDGKIRGVYGYVAPFYKQAKSVAWDYIKFYTAPIPGRKVNEAELWVELPNQARIRVFGADNPDALRGLYLDGVVMDEVAQMRPEVWGEIIRPALSDRLGWAIFIGTPKGINTFSELYQRAERDDTGQWGALMLPVSETLGDADPPLSPGEVEQARADMGEQAFRQEYLCDFAADNSDSFISYQDVVDAERREPPDYNEAPLIMGVDIAAQGHDRSCLVLRRGPALGHIDIWREADTMTTVGRVAEMLNKCKPRAAFMDACGLGIGPVDRLKQLGHRVIGVNSGAKAGRSDLYANLKAEMWSRLAEWLETASIPDNIDLRKDLLAPRREYDPQNRLKVESKDALRRRGLASTDVADALALTFAQPVAAVDRAARRPRYAESDLCRY